MNADLSRLGITFDVEFLLRLLGLIFARFIGASFAIPFMGGQLIPGRLKFGIPLVFSCFLYPFIATTVARADVPEFNFAYFGLVAKEVFVGFSIGFTVGVPFYAVEAAGSFMDTQRGTTFAQTIAPFLGGQASLLGNLYLLLFMAIFLGMGGNHLVIAGIGDSYRVLPLLSWPRAIQPGSPWVDDVIALSADIFAVGLQIAAPVVVCMFLVDATLGVVNRVAPNIQVFWLGQPIKTLLGLVIVFVAVGHLSKIFGGIAVQIFLAMRRAVAFVAGGG
jgi:flagellar biosynthetic protein FliR